MWIVMKKTHDGYANHMLCLNKSAAIEERDSLRANGLDAELCHINMIDVEEAARLMYRYYVKSKVVQHEDDA